MRPLAATPRAVEDGLIGFELHPALRNEIADGLPRHQLLVSVSNSNENLLRPKPRHNDKAIE